MGEIVSRIRNYLPDAEVYLFGSSVNYRTARGDVDIVVVSQRFDGVVSPKRRKMIVDWVDDSLIDPICLSQSEFRRFLEANNEFAATVLPTLRRLEVEL